MRTNSSLAAMLRLPVNNYFNYVRTTNSPDICSTFPQIRQPLVKWVGCWHVKVIDVIIICATYFLRHTITLHTSIWQLSVATYSSSFIYTSTILIPIPSSMIIVYEAYRQSRPQRLKHSGTVSGSTYSGCNSSPYPKRPRCLGTNYSEVFVKPGQRCVY